MYDNAVRHTEDNDPHHHSSTSSTIVTLNNVKEQLMQPSKS